VRRCAVEPRGDTSFTNEMSINEDQATDGRPHLGGGYRGDAGNERVRSRCAARASRPIKDSPSQVTEPAFATLSGGEVMGANVGGVYEFKGIPYASAARYQEPQPTSWVDVKKALAFGEVCPNGATTVNVHEFVTTSNHDLVENEASCLNLNVWSTSLQAEEAKPVVVWLHGGGFSSGSSAELPYYDGANLAQGQDVVVVSVNHRLNALGYLDLSAYGPEYANTGSLGQLDLVAALTWVKQNAAQFGGDANNVTIVGQSGGAGKVMTLLGMPSAQGLFHKAYVLSGGSSGTPQANARAATVRLFQTLGISTVEELKALPYKTIQTAAATVRAGTGPVIDGNVYPAATISNGKFTDLAKDIPLVVTNTFGEVCGNSVPLTSWSTSVNPLKDVYRPDVSDQRVDELLTAKYGTAKDAIVAEFKKAYPTHELFDLLFFMAGGCGPNRVPTVTAKVAQGGAPVYSGVYAMNLPWFGGVVSVHTGGDLPFLFDNAETIPDLIAGDEKNAFDLAKDASGALGRFAHTGDPSQPSLKWPSYQAASRSTMVFDVKSGAVNGGADETLIGLINAPR
jgi:para-nitrobenzyl esterase